ncbi:MAG: hypothetical protein NC548_36595 [Lachnospiraceae bacterium]|nr:hypothetical protein [Lachnospiraceae bacterium]
MNIGGLNSVSPAIRSGMMKTNRQSAKKNDTGMIQNAVAPTYSGNFNLKLGGLTSMAKPDGSNITVYKADSYTKDTPLLRIVTTDANGKETEQIINPNEVDMTNATEKEMFALDAYLADEGITDSAYTLGIFTDDSVTDTKKNFMDILKELRDMQYKAGNLSGYAKYNNYLGACDFWEKRKHQLDRV